MIQNQIQSATKQSDDEKIISLSDKFSDKVARIFDEVSLAPMAPQTSRTLPALRVLQTLKPLESTSPNLPDAPSGDATAKPETDTKLLDDVVTALAGLTVEKPVVTQSLPETNTLFWAVDVNEHYKDVFTNIQISNELMRNEELKPNKEIHTTLLFVGAKFTPLEAKYDSMEALPATVVIDAYGVSECALALRVKELVCGSDKLVTDGVIQEHATDEPYSHVSRQHITLALKKGTPRRILY